MEKVLRCISTNVELTNKRGSVVFRCPKCSDADIVRSFHAREVGAKYTCPNCKFEGPN
ncbi:MAG TPA: zinc finger domain-containing protein [Candidatus Nanoarchaeia archaeon]|nr:zinc finger domain-containing protein [Candidatus Nanoarchaeia archaeon]